MIANASVDNVLSVGEVAEELGVCVATVRNMVERGMPCHTLPSGHRRFSRREVRQWIGGNEEQTVETVPLALTGRVSSAGQNRAVGKSDKSSLDHQIDRVETYATERFGEETVANASRYYRVASGLNFNCPILTRLVNDILSGKFRGGYIVCQDNLRILRFGMDLLELICQHGGCTLLYVMEPEREDAQTDLTNSILGIITHFTAKASGLKSKECTQILVSEDTLVTMHKLQQSGYSLRMIEQHCDTHNIKGTKGQKLTAGKIQRLLVNSSEILEKLMYDEQITKTSFEEFVEECIQTTYVHKHYIKRKDILKKYEEWCNQTGKPKFSASKVSKIIQNMNWTKRQDSDSVVIYRGIRWRK